MNGNVDTTPLAATDFAAAAEAIASRFDEAASVRPRERFRFGALSMEMEVREPTGGDLAARLLQRIDHARVTSDDPAIPSNVAVKAVSLGGRIPDAVAALADAIPCDVEYVHLSDGGSLRAAWQPDCGALDIMNLETGDALSCVTWPDRVPGWLLSAPFRHLLNWASLKLPAFEAHGAGIQYDGTGLLLVGASGAGKSTLTAWAAEAGFETVGDDAVLVEQRPGQKPRGYALFDNFKVGEEMRRRLPFAERLDWLDTNSRNKSMAALSQIGPNAFVASIPLAALVVPKVSGRQETRITRSDAGAAIRALGPSTLHQFKGGERLTFPKLATLCRLLPVFEMHTGTDRDGAVAALADLCRELKS